MSRRRRLDCLQRKADYLRDVAIPRAQEYRQKAASYMAEELSALEWAIGELSGKEDVES